MTYGDRETSSTHFGSDHNINQTAPWALEDERTPLLVTKHVESGYEAPDEQPPPDRFYVAYVLTMLLGMGMLFPWNAFITVNQYFDKRFKGSSFDGTIENYFSVTFQIFNIVCLLVSLRVQNSFSVSKRVIISLFIQLVVFTLTTALVKAEGMDINTYFGITVVCVALSGAATAFLQGGLFGLAGMLPSRYVQALMTGQGLAGVTVSACNIFSLITAEDVYDSAFIYFLVSVIVIGMCFFAFFVVLKLPIVRYYLKRSEKTAKAVQETASFRTVFREVRPLAAQVFLTFFISLSVFPSVAADVHPTTVSDSRFFGDLFVPVYCFLGFNLGDLVGRSLAGVYQWPEEHLWLPVLLQSGYIPLFMLCNVVPSSLPHVLTADAWPIVLMVTFAITNGYFGACIMMYGPTKVAAHEGEACGSLMVTSLTCGLGFGSFFSFALKAILCSCNPFVAASS
eukprot:Colp12_sorted_trinity150504_noHs@405